MSTCNRVDLESLGSWPIMPKNFPGIGLEAFVLSWARIITITKVKGGIV
jgi:hypothetical protein